MKILIVGMGTVGRGLLEAIAKMEGKGAEVVGIVDLQKGVFSKGGFSKEEMRKVSEKGIEALKFENVGAEEAIAEKEYDALVEMTPTNLESGEPATSYIRKALGRGKHVVTSNKGPVALHYWELKKLAEKNNCELKFEATVCAAIPIFNTAENCLKGNRIISAKGILNGTTNYILTKMENEKRSFDDVLKEAQKMGIAEKNASYDIDGIDAAAKVTIIANALLERKTSFAEVKRTGIARITQEAISLAREEGYAIKLIGEASEEKAEVSPKLVPISNPLAGISGTLNAITLETELAGELTFVGKGAGRMETASAVLSDILGLK